MRQHFQQYVNSRPSVIFEGISAPTRRASSSKDLDWLILRENTEGEYAGQGGRTHVGTEYEVATEVAIFTRKGIERFIRFAFEAARNRPRKLLTVVTKSNAQVSFNLTWSCSYDSTWLNDALYLEIRTYFMGRSGGIGSQGLPGRDLGQDVGRRDDRANGSETSIT